MNLVRRSLYRRRRLWPNCFSTTATNDNKNSHIFSKRVYAPNVDGSPNFELLHEIVVDVAVKDAAETPSITFTQIVGGLTNQIYRADFTDGRESLLVRVFGGEKVVDRR